MKINFSVTSDTRNTSRWFFCTRHQWQNCWGIYKRWCIFKSSSWSKRKKLQLHLNECYNLWFGKEKLKWSETGSMLVRVYSESQGQIMQNALCRYLWCKCPWIYVWWPLNRLNKLTLWCNPSLSMLLVMACILMAPGHHQSQCCVTGICLAASHHLNPWQFNP